jgi:hypothetical protein
MLDALDTSLSYDKPFYGKASRGDQSAYVKRVSNHLKTSFVSAVEEHTFEPAYENRPRVLEIAGSLGIKIVRLSDTDRREDLHGNKSGAARAFQEAQRVEIVRLSDTNRREDLHSRLRRKARRIEETFGIITICYKRGESETLGSPHQESQSDFHQHGPRSETNSNFCMFSGELMHSYRKTVLKIRGNFGRDRCGLKYFRKAFEPFLSSTVKRLRQSEFIVI